MKKLFFLLFIALTHVSVYGQGEISFDNKTIDVGDVDISKKPIKVEFKFKNIGNEAITIKQVVCSDDHLNLLYHKSPIEPGKEGVITVEGTFANQGTFKKTITVRTTGKVEMTRLRLLGNNIAEYYNPNLNKLTELVQGGEFGDWLNKNMKLNLNGIEKKITYKLSMKIKIDENGNITQYEYKNNALPQAVISEIERLTKISPQFTNSYTGRSIERNILINKYHYSNPNDKAYDGANGESEMEKYVSDKIQTSLNKNTLKNKSYNVYFIVERDGSITNVMGTLFCDKSSMEDLILIKEAIKKVENVRKTTKVGTVDGKKCRTKCRIYVKL